MVALPSNLITKHKFQSVTTGKFTFDQIEGRFGWCHLVNGDNFYMSNRLLFQAEKKSAVWIYFS